jgi:predicted kinase
VGKSTLARRYGIDHPGALVCDVDVLRMMVAGWQDDFQGSGHRSRTVALAAIRSYLASGDDVVLPQLVARRQELARFRSAAEMVGGDYVGVVIDAPPQVVIERFRRRASVEVDDPWVRVVSKVVEESGGDEALTRSCREVDDLVVREHLTRVPSSDLETTYRELLLALGERP